MTTDALKLVEALLKAHMHTAGALASKPVITVSRDYGSGGRSIAERLGKRLGIPVYDKELLNAVAERSGADPNLMARLDEKTRGFWDAWITSLMSGENMLEAKHRRYLVKVVLGILNTGNGGVIIGRGSHIILAQQPVFRVRVTASPETCAKRVAAQRGMTLEEARMEVARVNQERGNFVWAAFKQRLNDPAAFDLTINTDHLNNYEEVAEIVILAMQYRHGNYV